MKLPALLPALLALFLFPVPAKAATHEIDSSTGTTIDANDGDIITTNGAHVTSTVPDNVINVNTSGGPVTITLQNIDVETATNWEVINITGNNDCTIILNGKVKLTATGTGSAIRYNGAGTLTIEGAADSGSVISGGGSGIYASSGDVNISGRTGDISGDNNGRGISADGSVDISGTTGNISGFIGISAGGSVTVSGRVNPISGTSPAPSLPTIDLAALIAQIQQSPETAALLANILAVQPATT